jgi:hypothetical protein
MEWIEGCGSKADGSAAVTSKKPRLAVQVQEIEHDVSIMEMVRESMIL